MNTKAYLERKIKIFRSISFSLLTMLLGIIRDVVTILTCCKTATLSRGGPDSYV